MKTLLILHGWGSSKEKWEEVRKKIEEEARVLVPDLPGFKQETELSSAWDLDDYVDWLEEYVRENLDSPFFILGHSFGGGLALKFAAENQNMVSGLVLVSAAAVRVKKKKDLLIADVAGWLNKLSFLPGYERVRRFFYYYILKKPDYINARGVLRQTFKNIIENDLQHLFSKIEAPTLIIWGAEDKITPLSEARLIKKRIPGSRIEILKGVGHSPHLEAPEKLITKVVDFMDQ